MAILNFLKPKWKHKNAAKRYIEVERLTNQKSLTWVAINDEDPKIRKIATFKLTNQDTLNTIAKTDKDKYVRLEAVKKIINKATINEIMKKEKETIIRELAISKVNDPELLEYVAKNDEDKVIRQKAIELIADNKVLTYIILNDNDFENVIIALNRNQEFKDFNNLSDFPLRFEKHFAHALISGNAKLSYGFSIESSFDEPVLEKKSILFSDPDVLSSESKYMGEYKGWSGGKNYVDQKSVTRIFEALDYFLLQDTIQSSIILHFASKYREDYNYYVCKSDWDNSDVYNEFSFYDLRLKAQNELKIRNFSKFDFWKVFKFKKDGKTILPCP